jgi:hypothetical protein
VNKSYDQQKIQIGCRVKNSIEEKYRERGILSSVLGV